VYDFAGAGFWLARRCSRRLLNQKSVKPGVGKASWGWPRLLAAGAGAYALLGGALSLLGWAADIRQLTDWGSTSISIQPNSTIAAMSAGVALLGLVFGVRWLTVALGMLAGLIGAMSVGEHAFSLDLGIDQLFLFARPWGELATVSAGRIGPPAATSFTLLGLALVLSGTDSKARRLAPAIALGVMTIAMLPLVGYALEATTMFARPHLTAIAFQTATMLLALGMGLVASDTTRQPMRLLCEESAAGMLFRRALPLVILLPVAVGWVCVRGQVDFAFGNAMLVLLLIVIFVALLWFSASSIGSRLHAEERFARFMHSLPGLAWIKDGQGRYVYVNDAAEKAFDKPRQQIFGKSDTELFPSEIAAVFQENDRRALVEGSGVQAIETLAHEDGVHHSLVSKFSIPGLHGQGALIGGVAIDITDRRRAEQALARERELLQAIFDTIPAMITMYEPGTKVLRLNPEFQRVTGWSTADASSESLMENCYPDPQYRNQVAEFMQSCRDGWMDIELRAKDGRCIQSSWANIRLSDRTEVGIGIDITDRKRAEEALREADRRKDEFLATLAHELRNPLAPVRNALEMMKQVQDDPALIANARDMMQRQVSHMARLIDDLMDINRITRGKLVLREQRVDICEIVRDAAEICRSIYGEKRHEVRIDLPPPPLYVRGDPVRLEQIVGNLLNNACKYTADGGIVSAGAQREGSDVVIRVKDNGIGIKADMLARVFEMFTQAHGSDEQSAGGLGIGLSLVRGLVELHGGSVSAHSDGEGRGCEFTVRLSALLEQPTPVRPTVPVGNSSVASGKGRRLLVVDDNKDAAKSLAMLLKFRGYQTQTANDGEAAVSSAQSFQPDIILLDIGLPKLNGYDACRAIRAQSGDKQPLIVALTGWGQEEDRRKSAEAGFDAHLVKPIDYESLVKVLEELSANVSVPAEASG
jgi:PAS domain S-box-containing protein